MIQKWTKVAMSLGCVGGLQRRGMWGHPRFMSIQMASSLCIILVSTMWTVLGASPCTVLSRLVVAPQHAPHRQISAAFAWPLPPPTGSSTPRGGICLRGAPTAARGGLLHRGGGLCSSRIRWKGEAEDRGARRGGGSSCLLAGARMEVVDVAGDRGCLKRIVRKGSGSETPDAGSTIRLHYVISTAEGKRIDSSRDRGEEFSFQLGSTPSDAMAGWEAALATMTLGEVAEVVCSPAYAYGAVGAPPIIPPNATLSCELELLGWQGAAERRVMLAEQYTPTDTPEEAVYDKYKDDMQSGETLKDEGLNTAGKKKEVWKFDDVRLKKLTRRDQKVAGKGYWQGTNFTWRESEMYLDLFVALPVGADVDSVDCDIRQSSLRFAVKGHGVLFEGKMRGKVAVTDSIWVMDEDDTSAKEGDKTGGLVHISLLKLKPYLKIWGAVFESEADPKGVESSSSSSSSLSPGLEAGSKGAEGSR